MYSIQSIFLGFILILALLFLGILFISVIRNRRKIQFYSLIVKEDGQISKVGIAFIFLLILLVYQVVTRTEVSAYLVELLGVIFAAEIGNRYVDSRTISKRDFAEISDKLKYIDKRKQSAPAKSVDDIDFNDL